MEKREEVINLMKEKFNSSVINEKDTIASLGLDSLDVVEFLLDLEEKYNVSFEAEETKDIKTVGEMVDLICSKIK